MTNFSIALVTNFIIDNVREAKSRGEPITREKLTAIVDMVAEALKAKLDPAEREKLLRDLYSNEQTSTDEIRVLEDADDPNWEEWLPGRRGSCKLNSIHGTSNSLKKRKIGRTRTSKSSGKQPKRLSPPWAIQHERVNGTEEDWLLVSSNLERPVITWGLLIRPSITDIKLS